MNNFNLEERSEALQILTSTIGNCRKMQPKFAAGTSQHTLLDNRINALLIAQFLMESPVLAHSYSKEELQNALSPLVSIKKKCETAEKKSSAGTPQYTRYKKLIRTMILSIDLITATLDQIGNDEPFSTKILSQPHG